MPRLMDRYNQLRAIAWCFPVPKCLHICCGCVGCGDPAWAVCEKGNRWGGARYCILPLSENKPTGRWALGGTIGRAAHPSAAISIGIAARIAPVSVDAQLAIQNRQSKVETVP
ncbi:hypothetical protein O77CONTIG1_03378 [Leptolyngbya sp. O-77]|nr:hypothetical protein O77CONTIG1_03378 [Leptolyngbya sp. O-77]